MPTLIERMEERGQLVQKQRELVDKYNATDSGVEWSPEDNEKFQRLDSSINRLGSDIEREQKLQQREKQEADLRRQTAPQPPNRDDQMRDGVQAAGLDDSLVAKAMENVVRRIMRERPTVERSRVNISRSIRLNENRASQEYSDAAYSFLRGGLDGIDAEQRATLQIDSNIGGGFLKPPETFINRMIAAADSVVVLREYCTIFAGLNYGDSLGAVSLSGDIGAFEWGSGELTTGTEDTGIEFGKRELEPKSLKRKIVKISEALLNNSRMDVEGIVIQRATQALRGTLETAYMTGNGAQRPLGLFVASDNGIPTSRDVSMTAATTIAADDLIDIQGTLRDAYQPNARWLCHRDFITKVRKLKTADGQYLFQPGLQMGVPDMLLGKAYTVSEFAPNTFTASQYVVLYGDLSWYWIAEAWVDMEVQRLIEKYAENGQIGLLFKKMAADAMPVLPEAFVRGQMKSA